MEYNHVPSSPICTLKVDIKCCDECPIKLKKKLLKTNGVTSVDIDSKKGKVTVMGDIDPRILMQMFEKMGKPAELWSFQKSPSQDERNCNKKKKEARFACDDDEDMDDGSYVSKDEYLSKRSSTATRRPMHGNNHGQDSFSRKSGASFSRSSVLTPRPPSRSPTIFPNPIMYSGPSGYYGSPLLLPSRPTYRYGYGYEYLPSRPLTKYNPIIHYTSYWDNYRLSQ